jgi:hypothetical protein
VVRGESLVSSYPMPLDTPVISASCVSAVRAGYSGVARRNIKLHQVRRTVATKRISAATRIGRPSEERYLVLAPVNRSSLLNAAGQIPHLAPQHRRYFQPQVDA